MATAEYGVVMGYTNKEDGGCDGCEYYDADDDRYTAFICDGIDCPLLPCEMEDCGNDDQ